MSNVTLEAIEDLFDRKMDEKLEPLKHVLSQHTAALDQLMKASLNKDDERLVTTHRLDRLEHWAKIVGQKSGVKLEI